MPPCPDRGQLFGVSCSALLGCGLLDHLHPQPAVSRPVDEDFDAVLTQRVAGVKVEAEGANAVDA